MTPGIKKTLIFLGAVFAFHLVDRRVAARNEGWGILHSFSDWLIADGEDPEIYYAKIEEVRQRTKEHYELSQRPIYRSSYPEYVQLKNEFGDGF
jgi:hypothetical protein